MNLFHDRRPTPATRVKLTPRQKDLAAQYGIGTADDKGDLTVTAAQRRAVVEASGDMMHRSQEWGPDRRGELASAKNLHQKLVGAVVNSSPDQCPACHGDGCRACLLTGRRL